MGGEGVATIRQMRSNVANAASGVYVKEIGGLGGGGGVATIRCTGTWLMQHQVCGDGEMMVGMGRGK